MLSHMVEDGNAQRLAPVTQELVWKGFTEARAQEIQLAWGGCADPVTCGNNQPWCWRCTALLTEFGQAFNVEVVTELMLNWLACWYEGEFLPSRGHCGPVHRCGAACPYRRAQSDYSQDSWSGLL